MKKSIYAIRMGGGSWYRSHGKWNGIGCIQTEAAAFPGTFYDTKNEASANIYAITRDFPNDGINCAIVRITYSMVEVFV